MTKADDHYRAELERTRREERAKRERERNTITPAVPPLAPQDHDDAGEDERTEESE